MFVITKDDKPVKWGTYVPGPKVPEKNKFGKTYKCPECGSQFTARRPGQKFCSRTCSAKGQIRHRKAGRKIKFGKRNAAQS